MRFIANVRQYPKLFAVLLVGAALDVIEISLWRTNSGYRDNVLLAHTALALILAMLLYRWIFRNAKRTSIFLNILSLLEGRDVCTIAEHFEPVENEEEEEGWHT